MGLRMTEEEYREFLRTRGDGSKPQPTAQSDSEGRPVHKSRQNKYGNEPIERDGKRFASKHESRVYDMLRMQCLAGEHLGLSCQVAFYLPGGVKYIADFVTYEHDGSFTVYDAKSEATRKDRVYRLKKRQMKECLGIDIQEVQYVTV